MEGDGIGLWAVVTGTCTAPPTPTSGSGAHTVMSPENDRSPAASLSPPWPRPVTLGPWRRPGCPVRSGWHKVRAGGGFPLLTPSLGKQASGEGAGGGFPSTPWLSHQLQPAFQPGWELVPVPKKAPVGGRGLPAAGQAPLSEPAPSWTSLCLLLLPKLPHTSSRLSSSACTFSPSWADRRRPPGGLKGRGGLMSGSERTWGKSGSGGVRRPRHASSRSRQASETRLC